MKNYKNYLLIALGIVISTVVLSIAKVNATNEQIAETNCRIINDWGSKKLLTVSVDGLVKIDPNTPVEARISLPIVIGRMYILSDPNLGYKTHVGESMSYQYMVDDIVGNWIKVRKAPFSRPIGSPEWVNSAIVLKISPPL